MSSHIFNLFCGGIGTASTIWGICIGSPRWLIALQAVFAVLNSVIGLGLIK